MLRSGSRIPGQANRSGEGAILVLSLRVRYRESRSTALLLSPSNGGLSYIRDISNHKI